MQYLKKRKSRKMAESTLHAARHMCDVREDVMPPSALEEIRSAMEPVRKALAARDTAALDSATIRLSSVLDRHHAPRRFPRLRENLEVLLVAATVAMAFRTYFLQPFKIPTGSMQPTLYGIHYEPPDGWGALDRFPLSLVSRVVFGRVPTEIRSMASGQAVRDPRIPDDSPNEEYYVGGIRHTIPAGMKKHFAAGEYVIRGQLLASGVRIGGDHIFVDKVRWNFVRPRRDQIMVFRTHGIRGIPPDIHYIKRLVGLPGETIGVRPPNLLVNGAPLGNPPPGIARVQSGIDGYAGYLPAPVREFRSAHDGAILRSKIWAPDDCIRLKADQYLGFGDNTRNSLDGRYWGPVPRENMVGPALVVYWPVSRRFGPIR